jgi:hypothetical protein
MHNLFSLPCLSIKQTKGKNTLVDYSQSHVITSNQPLNIMWKKTMDKVVVDEIKEDRWKEREEKKLKKAIDVRSIVDQTTQKVVEKCVKP